MDEVVQFLKTYCPKCDDDGFENRVDQDSIAEFGMCSLCYVDDLTFRKRINDRRTNQKEDLRTPR